MKNYLLLALLLATGTAGSEWLKVYDQGGNTISVDQDSIGNDKEFPIVWQLHNYSSRSPFGDLSSVNREEYDCKKERYRTLTQTTFSEPMAEGKATFKSSDALRVAAGDWHSISTGNMVRSVLERVCAK